MRDPDEYAAGHVAGAISAPGGQLVQATDQYAGTLHARIVLVDDKAVRAVMTASWLTQMGWREVYVLVAAGEERGVPPVPVLGEAARDAAIDAAALNAMLTRATKRPWSISRSAATISAAHIPGAWFVIRARLVQFIQREPLRRNVVLTSEDGVLASLAVNEARAWTPLAVHYLDGGNAAWRAAGLPLTARRSAHGRPADRRVAQALRAPRRRQAGDGGLSRVGDGSAAADRKGWVREV